MGKRMFETTARPEDIIGSNNMDTFVTFMEICKSGTNGGEYPHKRLDKELASGARDGIAQALKTLREHGFYPLSVESGVIKWGVVMKSASQELMEDGLLELQGLPEEEVIRLGRQGARMIDFSMPKATREDYAIEELRHG